MKSGSNPKKKVFLLLDLDESLVDNNATTLNEVLLELAHEFGAIDVCILTNMTSAILSNDLPAEGNPPKYNRPALVQALKDRGFIVHKVITSNDPIYDAPGDYYTNHWLPAYNKLSENPNMKHDERNNLLEAIDEKFMKNQRSIDEQAKSLSGDEKAKLYASNQYDKGRAVQFSMQYLNSLSITKNIIPGSFIAIDDKKTELDSISAASTKEKNLLPLTTLQIQTREPRENILSDIPVTDKEKATFNNRKEEIKQRYREKFIEHFEKLDKLGDLDREQKRLLANAKTISLVFTMDKTYKQLKRTTNISKIESLKEKIGEIQAKTIPTGEKMTQMSKVLEEAFRQAEKDYGKYRIWPKPGDFINRLRNIEDKSFHYPRMLGLILKQHYAQCRKLHLLINEQIATQVSSLQPHIKYPHDFAPVTLPLAHHGTFFDTLPADANPLPGSNKEGQAPSTEEQKKIIINIISELRMSKLSKPSLISDLERIHGDKKPTSFLIKANEDTSGLNGAIKVLMEEFRNQIRLLGIRMKNQDGNWVINSWEEAQRVLDDNPSKYDYPRLLASLINQLCEANNLQSRFPDLKAGNAHQMKIE